MPGRGEGDGGVAKGHGKKRNLDYKLRVSLGAGNPDAKRRHTAGGHGQRDDDGTSNSLSFQSSAKDAQRYGTSKFPKSQLDILQISSRPSSSLPTLQRQRSSKPPNSTGLTAKASGAPGASGSSRGAKPGGPGVFSRRDRPTWKQNRLPNGPPTLSSTSSDASSISAGSTEAPLTSKHVLNRSSRSLRHGRQSADGAASRKDGSQNQDVAEHVATTGPQRRLSNTRDKVLPASQVRETERHPYVSISSDDGSYGSSSSGNDEQDNFSTNPSELERVMAQSKVWACIAPLVPQNWTASITDGPETRAFIQAISLPLRSKLDTQWLRGIKNSHQRAYRALMSVVLQVIGVDAHCKPCESRILEKQRNCKVLPPQAAGMRELQEVYGSQCVNCYFFQAAKPCEFPVSPTMIKETPIPIPVLPFPRPIATVESSLDPPAAARPAPAASPPQAPTYSSYKVSKGEKPISQSPVPIPSFGTQGSNNQSQFSHTTDVSLWNPQTQTRHQSRHITMADARSASRNSNGLSDNTHEAVPHSATSVTSNTGPSEAALTLSGFMSSKPSTRESTVATSNLSSGENPRSQLVARAFSLFGDISRLPVEEQASLWNQMQQMARILETGAAVRPSTTMSRSPSLSSVPSAIADDWEVAPGRIIAGDKYQMLSTSFLSRESVSLKAAQQVSTSQWVLNKSIAALNQLSVGHEEGWDCQCSVIRGVLKVKIGDVRTRIGQGGLIIVDKECIITNVSHKEARIQVWWRKEDD